MTIRASDETITKIYRNKLNSLRLSQSQINNIKQNFKKYYDYFKENENSRNSDLREDLYIKFKLTSREARYAFLLCKYTYMNDLKTI